MVTFQDAVLDGWGRRGWSGFSQCCGGSESIGSLSWVWFVLELDDTILESGYLVCIVVAGECQQGIELNPPEAKQARSEEAH